METGAFVLLPFVIYGKNNYQNLDEKDAQITENMKILDNFLDWPAQSSVCMRVLSVLKERQEKSSIFDLLDFLSDIITIVSETTKTSDERDYRLLTIFNDDLCIEKTLLKIVNRLQKTLFQEIFSYIWHMEWYIDGVLWNENIVEKFPDWVWKNFS